MTISEFGNFLSIIIFGGFVPTLFTLVVVTFLWGALRTLVQGSHDEEARENGKAIMFYSSIALVVVAALWAVLAAIGSAFTGAV